jgi:hypothetical protein
MTFQKCIYSHIHVYTSRKRFSKNMHNYGILTRYLVHTYHLLNHCAASVNTSVLFLSLISTIHRSLCPALPHHLAAGFRHPARAPQRPTRLVGHLDSQGPDSEFLVLAAGGMQALAVQVLNLKRPRLAVATDCAPVDRLQLDSWPVEVYRSTKGVTPGRPGLATASGQGLELELSLWPGPSVHGPALSAMRIPSQTAGLVSTSHKTRFDAIQVTKHNKTF